jgi:hypothetical protein
MEAVLILLPLAVAALLVWLLSFSAPRYWAVVALIAGSLLAVTAVLTLVGPFANQDPSGRFTGVSVFFVGPLACAALVVHLVKRIPSRLVVAILGACAYALALYGLVRAVV